MHFTYYGEEEIRRMILPASYSGKHSHWKGPYHAHKHVLGYRTAFIISMRYKPQMYVKGFNDKNVVLFFKKKLLPFDYFFKYFKIIFSPGDS